LCKDGGGLHARHDLMQRGRNGKHGLDRVAIKLRDKLIAQPLEDKGLYFSDRRLG
jgi:hypothetical protein